MNKGTIRRRLLSYFALALLMYSLVAGAVFLPLLRSQTMTDYETYMRSQASSIADFVAPYLSGSTAGTGSPGGRNAGEGGGYGAYLRFVDDISVADVWIIDQDMNLVRGNNQTEVLDYNTLPEDAGDLIRQAFLGETAFSNSFESVFETATLTLSMPVTSGDDILGVVLLHAPVDGIQGTTWESLRLLGISILIGLFLSAILAVYLASSFTRPLAKIKKTAMGLSEGDYEVQTGVSQGGEIGALAVALDGLGNQLKRADAQSRELDQLRRDFVANISHELNTPVTVLRGSLEALQDQVIQDPKQISQTHDALLQETISLQNLVLDLMELTRLQSTGFSIQKEALNLSEPLSDAIRSAGPLALSKGVAIHCNPGDTPIPFDGDYRRLTQMFLTVLDNAVKYSPDGGAVEVLVEPTQVTVADAGPGISPEDLPHVFDRFYRAHSGTQKQGTGLGLAIAKEIADRHGIEIRVVSSLGEGTRFMFLLPGIHSL